MISMFPRPLKGNIPGNSNSTVLVLGVGADGGTLRYLVLRGGTLSIVNAVANMTLA